MAIGGSAISRAKTLLFLTDSDCRDLTGSVPELMRAGRRCDGTTAHRGQAVADWIGMILPAPAAELRLAGETGSAQAPGGRFAVCMDPVSLAADMRELHMLDAAPVLDSGEAAALIDTIRPSLSDRQMDIHMAAPGRWYALAREGCVFEAAAPEVVQAKRLRSQMPAGRDGAHMRTLMNEIQMQLHDHAVNRARARRGLPPVNSVWFWGADPLAAPTGPDAGGELPPLLSADPLLRGLWLTLGGDVRRARNRQELKDAARFGCVATISTEDFIRLDPGGRGPWGTLRIVSRDGIALDLSRRRWLVRWWRGIRA